MGKGKNNRIEEEQRTVELMIRLYCRYKEGNRTLCPECREMLDYSRARLSRCPFQKDKRTCRLCTIHCYRPDMKRRIRKVMRYAGSRMLWNIGDKATIIQKVFDNNNTTNTYFRTCAGIGSSVPSHEYIAYRSGGSRSDLFLLRCFCT